MKTPADLKAFGGNPSYHDNLNRAHHKGMALCQTDCCVLCGKKALGRKTYVLLTDMGEYTTREALTEYDLGEYPVGSDCAKKLKAAGVTVYTKD